MVVSPLSALGIPPEQHTKERWAQGFTKVERKFIDGYNLMHPGVYISEEDRMQTAKKQKYYLDLRDQLNNAMLKLSEDEQTLILDDLTEEELEALQLTITPKIFKKDMDKDELEILLECAIHNCNPYVLDLLELRFKKHKFL